MIFLSKLRWNASLTQVAWASLTEEGHTSLQIIEPMTRSTVLALIVCRGVFQLLAGPARWRFSNFALVGLACLVICQEIARIAVSANPICIAGLAVQTVPRRAIKGLKQTSPPRSQVYWDLNTVINTVTIFNVKLSSQHRALHCKCSVNSYPKLHSWHWLCAVRLLGAWQALQAPLGPTAQS